MPEIRLRVIFFSHGIVGSVELGYGQNNRGELSINKNIVEGLIPQAFDKPNTWFHSCNGATGGDNSIAKLWHDVTKGTTGAYVGKTTYEYIMYPKDYNRFSKIWSKKTRNIDINIKERRKNTGFSINGSDYYPVPSSGTTLVVYGGNK